MITQRLVFVSSFTRKNVGEIYDVLCPFCKATITVRKSTLNNQGKRCECGVLLQNETATKENG